MEIGDHMELVCQSEAHVAGHVGYELANLRLYGLHVMPVGPRECLEEPADPLEALLAVGPDKVRQVLYLRDCLPLQYPLGGVDEVEILPLHHARFFLYDLLYPVGCSGRN